MCPQRVNQWQRPEVGLRSPFEEQFVAEYLRCLRRGSAFSEREVGESIEVGLRSDRVRIMFQHTNGFFSDCGFHHHLPSTLILLLSLHLLDLWRLPSSVQNSLLPPV